MKVDKIVFLDIDGVLNSQQWAGKHYKMLKEGIVPEGVNDLCDPEATDRLISVLKETGAKIVLSSSWRSNTVQDTIEDFSTFRHKPFHKLVPYIIGVTPRFRERLYRGTEIAKWLEMPMQQRIDWKLILKDIEIPYNRKYVIVDDDEDMLDNQIPYFVHTDWITGLTEENIKQIKKIL